MWSIYSSEGELAELHQKLSSKYLNTIQTVISMSHYVYHVDETVFLDAHTFKPERWLTGDFHFLDKHLLLFSRRSRGCIRIKYVDIYLARCPSYCFTDI